MPGCARAAHERDAEPRPFSRHAVRVQGLAFGLLEHEGIIGRLTEPKGEPLLFLEVSQGDASEFTGDLEVCGAEVGRHRLLRTTSPAIPNAIAALLIHLRDMTRTIPDARSRSQRRSAVASPQRRLANVASSTSARYRRSYVQSARPSTVIAHSACCASVLLTYTSGLVRLSPLQLYRSR